MSEESESKLPGSLFGVADFFSILLPGGLLAFLLKDEGIKLFGTILPKAEGELARWLIFAVAAYFLGHLLHQAGDILDFLYDHTYKKMRTKKDKAQLLSYAKALISHRYRPVDGHQIEVSNISNFSWAGSYVRVRSEAAARELERGGADSKFFRSLVFVALVAVGLFGFKRQWWPFFPSLVLLLFSLWRFFVLRWKNSQRTYEYFIILRDLERLFVRTEK